MNGCPSARAALTAMAERKGWQLLVSDKGGAFNAATLGKFDAVIWNNISGDVLTLTQRKAFQAFVKRGGGYVGIHGSAGDPVYFWDWYPDTLIGAAVPGVMKAVKWNTPFYGVESGRWFLAFHCFTKYVKLTFFDGASLDPVPPGKSKQERVRYLDIREGELLALLGPSGSGKTTLLRVIAGLEQPDGGRVLFDGEDATSLSVQARRAGFVFQHYALFRHMTFFDNVKIVPNFTLLDDDSSSMASFHLHGVNKKSTFCR